ncbi:Uncharacterised protein (plasmid) [Tsukamurella tyrosinosolvens]|uniref:Uncharacterized protein n=2 Tax=Tsukamurella tyrosinosolvens TaxID=57704 RepID=A0A1H4WJI5_TSUTY|nr:hypothetical protein AXK58_24110 [Tsukamurella tyrosinosolvens]SEC93509.1 hypothetical protein SAMN04489793_3584 [Tsukamurella tyrosinosolvens]VEH89399.1 Uncharacterised protein [Tsukamurella tyrosinosolvens]
MLYSPGQGGTDSTWVAEGNRMLEMLVQPSDADPTLIEAVKDHDATPSVQSVTDDSMPKDAHFVAYKAKVSVALTRADRTDSPSTEVRVGAARYASDEHTTEAITAAQNDFRAANRAAIPNLTNGIAVETEPGVIDVLFRRGEIILTVHVKSPTTQKSTQLAADLYARQSVAASRFKPTPSESVPKIPLDRDGVLARALWSRGELSDRDQRIIGILTLPAFERRVGNNPLVPLLREAGADLVGWNLGIVIRMRDDAAALRFIEQGRASSKRKRVEGVLHTNDSVVCTQGDRADDISCAMVVGRYYANVSASDAVVVRQMAAAQWAILTQNP